MSSSSPRSSPRRRSSNRTPLASPPAADRSSSPVRSPALYQASSSSPVQAGVPSSPARAPVANSSPLPYGSQTTPVSTPHRIRSEIGTPRGDLGTNRNVRELDLNAPTSDGLSQASSTDGNAAPTSEIGPLSRTVIWGTSVSVADTKQKFKSFITNFMHDGDDKPKYERMIEQLVDTKKMHLNVDCKDLAEYDDDLFRQLLRYPQETIPIFDLVAHEYTVLQGLDIPTIQVRTFNLGESTNMRELNPDDIDQMISIKGMVIRTSAIIPDMKEAFFQCNVCNANVTVEIENGFIAEPQTCASCSTQKSYRLMHNRCKFADKQMVKLQETPEQIPDGATPQTVLAFCYDDIVDSVQPGDRVEVTGIYRATPLRLIARQRTVKSIYKTHIDVIHFSKVSGSRVRRDGDDDVEEDPALRAASERDIKELSEQPDIYNRLTQALAPNIFEFDDVKKGVLLQLFGGAHKDFTESGRGRFRGEVNVLLCGDPGTSKSQMLQYAVKLASRGLYTSGKGSSSVGLTAYVTKDPETKQLVLESGALVLCDGGICCIDEFDKMSDNTRSVLHEAMEQQTVSIAKAGIICSLNARTSILAAANPIDSRWNPKRSIVENVQLPPTLLSRFDLIYLILDNPDKSADRRLATHLVHLFYKDGGDKEQTTDVINREMLAKYISFARENIQPKLTEDASRDLVTAYVDMRKLGGNKNVITATPRQLESLIRLAEAHARVRLSEHVERIDVAEAVRLVKSAIHQAATDPRTGQIDMDLLTTGTSMASRVRIGDLSRAVAEALRGAGNVTLDNLLAKVQLHSDVPVQREDLRSALEQMQIDEEVIVKGAPSNPTIKLLQAN
eukprot:m.664642 g.664642  ORF g.664642 m.664642 type:complete len:842 (-) comp22746_c0_seq2:152-2677(-)